MEASLKTTAAVILAIALLALPVMGDAGPDAAAIYKAKCAICHGADGAGQTPVGKTMKLKDLRSPEVQKKTDKEIHKSISDGGGEGKAKMPPFKDKLEPVEIDALVAFVRQLAKK